MSRQPSLCQHSPTGWSRCGHLRPRGSPPCSVQHKPCQPLVKSIAGKIHQEGILDGLPSTRSTVPSSEKHRQDALSSSAAANRAMTGRTRNKLREARATKTKHGEIWQSIKKPSTQSNELRVRIAKLRLQVAQVIAHLGFNESRYGWPLRSVRSDKDKEKCPRRSATIPRLLLEMESSTGTRPCR